MAITYIDPTTAILNSRSLSSISLANASVSPGLIKFGRIKLPTMIAKMNEIINAIPVILAAWLSDILAIMFFIFSTQ